MPLVYIRMWWPAVVKSRLDYGRSPHAYVNQRLQIQLQLLMMSGIPLETCWTFNERWNNKFCYKVAFCGLFLLNHTTMHGSVNIKWIINSVTCASCWNYIPEYWYTYLWYQLRCILTQALCNTKTHAWNISKKVKCTLVQALRLCTGRTAHRGSRGIALLFYDQRH